jgi:pimeloyl-ACP methyl ester carboxylesterase
MLVIIRIFVAALLVCSTCAPGAAAPSNVGFVLLHGLAGVPLGSGGPGGALVGGLRKAGYRVETPEMCWSKRRIYDHTFTDCFADIDAAIARLRAQGATQIVLGGMSMGGNSALALAATHPDLLGVMAIAPAHDAATLGNIPRIAAALAQAQAAVAAGHGDAVQTYPDSDNSRRAGPAFTVRTSAQNYVSFIDPAGPANIAGDLPHIAVPVIWVAGTDDPTQVLSAQEFAQIPANPLSKYASVNAAHLATPDAGASAMIDWVRALTAAKS